MTESDELVASLAASDVVPPWVGNLAREVQVWRALIPEVIEQLEAIRAVAAFRFAPLVPDIDHIIAKLREAIQ